MPISQPVQLLLTCLWKVPDVLVCVSSSVPFSFPVILGTDFSMLLLDIVDFYVLLKIPSLYGKGQLYIFVRNHAISFQSVQVTLVHNVEKGKGDDQTNWRVLQHEKLARLKEKLRHSKEQVAQGQNISHAKVNFYIFKFHPVPIVMNKHTGRAKIGTMSADLKLKYGVLESALSTVFFFFHLSLLMVLL